MTGIPTYYPGQTARGSIAFASFERSPIEKIDAFFAYEETSSGMSITSDGLLPPTEDDNAWEAVFEFTIDKDDKPGLYRCSRVDVTYENGSVMHFDPLNAAFRIEKEGATNPEPLSDWRWFNR